VGYTCNIPKGPVAAIPMGIAPAGVMGMDTIAGVCTGEVGAPPGRRSTGSVSRGREWPAGPPPAPGAASGGVGMVTSRCLGHVVALDDMETRGHAVWGSEVLGCPALSGGCCTCVVETPRLLLLQRGSMPRLWTDTDTATLRSFPLSRRTTALKLRSTILGACRLGVECDCGTAEHAEQATYLQLTNCHDQSRCQTKPRVIISEDQKHYI
jgi:hypothetical protein